MEDPVEIRRRMQRFIERVGGRDSRVESRPSRVDGRAYFESLRRVVPHAVAHRHEPIVVLRASDETLFGCARCDAYGYARLADEVRFGGVLFARDCPSDTPPRATALTFVV